jgi:uncharacterized protein
MKLTVFGATGMVGKQIVKHALAFNHTVKAFGRNVESLIDRDLSNESLIAVKGYVFDEDSVYDAIKDSDAVISALGGDFSGNDKTRSLGLKNIITQMEKAGIKRIVALGGIGILSAEDGTLLIDQPDYPKNYLPVAKEHLQAYLYLKASSLDWTIVAAPNILEEDATGLFITSADYPPNPNKGKINAGDLALFMVTEVEKNSYIKHRVGISAT